MINKHDIFKANTTLIIQRPNGSLSNQGVVANTTSYELDQAQSSVNTPGFHELKPAQLPDHPYHKHVFETDYPTCRPIYREQFLNGDVQIWFYNGPGSAFFLDATESDTKYPVPADLRFRAIAKLQDELSNSSGSLAVSLAEADKTAKFVADTARRFAKAYTGLRKGRLGDFAEALGVTVKTSEIRAVGNRFSKVGKSSSDSRQFAANTWLEYSYAWKPMIQDVYDQSENFARILTEHSYIIREARGSASGFWTYTEEKLTSDKVWSTLKVVRVRGRQSFVVRYRIPNGGASVADTFGLNNPALVAWELVPFSFVADWFLPIGDFLSSLTAYNGLEFAGGVESRVRRATITCEGLPGPGGGTNPFGKLVGPYGKASGQYLHKNRTVLAGFPSQQLPSFKDPRSFAHAASAISLLQSVGFGSRKGLSTIR